MNKRLSGFVLICLCAAVMSLLAGCETLTTASREIDQGLTEADDWVREMAW